jgi:ABC-type dipeptide/oligopeptide/nickel transport system permease subunit
MGTPVLGEPGETAGTVAPDQFSARGGAFTFRRSIYQRRPNAILGHNSLRVGTAILALLIIPLALAPILPLRDPDAQSPARIFLPPGAGHLMGTDQYGRDILSRVLHGGVYTIGASVVIVALGGSVGTILGLLAGYLRGPVGFVVMRIVDVLLAFPGILLSLAAAAILGPGLDNGVLAIAIVLVPIYARVVEGATVAIRRLPYVASAVALGAKPSYIARRHILPNVVSEVVVLSTSYLGIAALYVASLGFLGLGVQPPTPEWGAMLNDGQNYVTLAWWIAFFPGIFLAFYVVAVNLIGDGLRDKLDPTVS